MKNLYRCIIICYSDNTRLRKVVLTRASCNNAAYDKAKTILRKQGLVVDKRYHVMKIPQHWPISAIL